MSHFDLSNDTARVKLLQFYSDYNQDFTYPKTKNTENAFMTLVETYFTNQDYSTQGVASIIEFDQIQARKDLNQLKKHIDQVLIHRPTTVDILEHIRACGTFTEEAAAATGAAGPVLISDTEGEYESNPFDGQGSSCRDMLQRIRDLIAYSLEKNFVKKPVVGRATNFGSYRLIHHCEQFFRETLFYQSEFPEGTFRVFVGLMHEIILPDFVVDNYRTRIQTAREQLGGDWLKDVFGT